MSIKPVHQFHHTQPQLMSAVDPASAESRKEPRAKTFPGVPALTKTSQGTLVHSDRVSGRTSILQMDYSKFIPILVDSFSPSGTMRFTVPPFDEHKDIGGGKWRDVYTFANGDKYKGEWKNEQKHGYGGMIVLPTDDRPSSMIYTGGWKNNMHHGYGIMIATNLNYFIKTCLGDTTTSAPPNKYEGQWMLGQPHGRGTLYFDDGDKYEGGWNDGFPCCMGTYTRADGSTYGVEWDADGKFVALVLD